MKLLLDIHLILWLASEPHKLSREAAALISAPDNSISYSVTSLWEIAIKNARGRRDFAVDVKRLRESLSFMGIVNLPSRATIFCRSPRCQCCTRIRSIASWLRRL